VKLLAAVKARRQFAGLTTVVAEMVFGAGIVKCCFVVVFLVLQVA